MRTVHTYPRCKYPGRRFGCRPAQAETAHPLTRALLRRVPFLRKASDENQVSAAAPGRGREGKGPERPWGRLRTGGRAGGMQVPSWPSAVPRSPRSFQLGSFLLPGPSSRRKTETPEVSREATATTRSPQTPDVDGLASRLPTSDIEGGRGRR